NEISIAGSGLPISDTGDKKSGLGAGARMLAVTAIDAARFSDSWCEVRYQEIPDEAWADAALGRGFNHHAVEHLSKLWQSIRTKPKRFAVTDQILNLGTEKRGVRARASERLHGTAGTSLRGRAMNRRKFLQTTLLPLVGHDEPCGTPYHGRLCLEH